MGASLLVQPLRPHAIRLSASWRILVKESVHCLRSNGAFCFSHMATRRKKRPKPRPRKGERGSVIGLALLLTRAEIVKLKALAASDLRSVSSYVRWLVALELSRPAPKRPVSSVRGAEAGDRRLALKVSLLLPREMREDLVARAEAEMRSVSSYAGRVVVETLAKY